MEKRWIYISNTDMLRTEEAINNGKNRDTGNIGNKRQNEDKQNKNRTLKKIRVITKLPISEQSYKGKVKTHKYINKQNQSTTGKLGKP